MWSLQSHPRQCAPLGIALVLGFQFLCAEATIEKPEDYSDSDAGRIVQQIKRLEARRNGMHLDTSMANAFLDDDQMLDPKTASFVKQSYETRKKRQAMDFDALPDSKWTNFPIKFKLDEAFEKDTDDARAAKANILDALKHFEDETCLRFEKITNNPEENHVIFRAGSSCVSFVGRTSEIPQSIILDLFCRNLKGEIVHYIAQTIGLWHQHQRTDRDDYVKVNFENIQAGEEGSFAIIPNEFIDTGGNPYDYASIMHYHSTYKSVSNGYTVVTHDPLYENTIGQRVGLSFYDAKLINYMYDCAARWCGNQISCRNNGYQDPNDCMRCKCPDGLGGRFCDEFQETPGCGGELTASPSEGYLTSPDYDSSAFYEEGKSCVWKIKSDDGGKIRLRFVGDFGMFCFSDACFQYVEIKYNGSWSKTGPRFCCDTLPSVDLVSETNEVLVIFKSMFKGAPESERRGFKLGFKTGEKIPPLDPIEPCDWIECENGGSCQNGQCDCNDGFIGDRCETDLDECSSNPCQNLGTCNDEVNGYQCECQPGWTGDNCETNVDDCAGSPCLNDGSCVDRIGGFMCRCREGFAGYRCQMDVNQCRSMPCKNGGTCENSVNDYKCVCPPEHTGRHCEILTSDPCDSAPCKNGGSCRSEGQTRICDCPQQFMGVSCDEAVPIEVPCAVNPCRNKGVCVPSGNTYRCECRGGLTGIHCQLGECGGCQGNPGELYDTCTMYEDPPQYVTRLKKVTTYTGHLWWRRRVDRYSTEMVRKLTEFCCDVAEVINLNSIQETRCGLKGWSDWSFCEPAGVDCCRQESHRYDFANFRTSSGGQSRRFGICETKQRYCDTTAPGCELWQRGCDECRPCD